MRRNVIILFALALIAAAAAGCGKAPDVRSGRDVSKIELLGIREFSQEEADVIKTFTKEEDIKTIVRALETSQKLDGILDVVMPEYGLRLYYKNGASKTYFLWVGKADNRFHGMIMDTEDTHTGYSLTEESARLLFAFLP